MKSIFLTFSRPSPSRRVKDAPTRITHWLMAICFFVAYITSEGETFRLLHVTMGYTLFGLVVFRLIYGIVGPRQARIAAATARGQRLLPIELKLDRHVGLVEGSDWFLGKGILRLLPMPPARIVATSLSEISLSSTCAIGSASVDP